MLGLPRIHGLTGVKAAAHSCYVSSFPEFAYLVCIAMLREQS